MLAAVPVKRRTVSADELFSVENVTLVPGEVYPEEGIHIIEVEAEGLLTSRSVLSTTVLCNDIDNMIKPSAYLLTYLLSYSLTHSLTHSMVQSHS